MLSDENKGDQKMSEGNNAWHQKLIKTMYAFHMTVVSMMQIELIGLVADGDQK